VTGTVPWQPEWHCVTRTNLKPEPGDSAEPGAAAQTRAMCSSSSLLNVTEAMLVKAGGYPYHDIII
jgi:hypothetical protein